VEQSNGIGYPASRERARLRERERRHPASGIRYLVNVYVNVHVNEGIRRQHLMCTPPFLPFQQAK